MTDTTRYNYSKIYAVVFAVLLTFLFTGITFLAFATIQEGFSSIIYYMAALYLLIIIGVWYVSKKLIIPVIRKEVALVLDNEKIVDYLDNKSIHWCDVKDLKTETTRTFDVWLVLTLTDYSEEKISTIWVQGRAKDILNNAKQYWTKSTDINAVS